jgi:hypothetical protein
MPDCVIILRPMSREVSIYNGEIMKKIACSMLLIFVFKPLLSLAEEPINQPQQITSPVEYNAKLADPFFEVEKWNYPWWIIENEDGTIENTMGGSSNKKDIQRLKQTANIQCDQQYGHDIHFCEASVQKDEGLNIFIYDESASTYDNLKITLKQNRFSCQYWTTYPDASGNQNLVWVTKSQRLTLDRNKFARGDVLKGKIEFVCEEHAAGHDTLPAAPKNISIKGVFKTVIE